MRPIEELHTIATIKVTITSGGAKELMTFYKKPMKCESYGLILKSCIHYMSDVE